MDTKEVATHLGTSPRTFRQFLRSPISTFVAVGSGARYEFEERDLPTIERRFSEWNEKGKPKPEGAKRSRTPGRKTAKVEPKIRQRDIEVWDEEESSSTGVPQMDDIRDPRVRRRIKADARAAEDRLMMLLMSKGLHITQLGDRTAS